MDDRGSYLSHLSEKADFSSMWNALNRHECIGGLSTNVNVTKLLSGPNAVGYGNSLKANSLGEEKYSRAPAFNRVSIAV
jgi:hypothetical protein